MSFGCLKILAYMFYDFFSVYSSRLGRNSDLIYLLFYFACSDMGFCVFFFFWGNEFLFVKMFVMQFEILIFMLICILL